MSDVFALDAAWRLHPQVAVRPEPFGALLYHFGTRRLSFLKDPVLRVVVESLAAHPSARAAVQAAGAQSAQSAQSTRSTQSTQSVPGAQTAHLVAALATLAGTGMIIERRVP